MGCMNFSRDEAPPKPVPPKIMRLREGSIPGLAPWMFPTIVASAITFYGFLLPILGCTSKAPDDDPMMVMSTRLTEVERQLSDANAQLKDSNAQLKDANTKLDNLKNYRVILPWRRTELDTVKGEAAPDIHAAIGHSLQAAADLCGKDQVLGFFNNMVGEIVSKRVPIDVGGAVKAKCQADATSKISELLSQ